MKTFTLFIFTLFIYYSNAQINPVLFNQKLTNSGFFPQSVAIYNNEIYIPIIEEGKIVKTSSLTNDSVFIDVLDNLTFPTSLKIIGNELYFIQAVTTQTLTNNSGKLQKIDLSQANPVIEDVLTGLNIPIVLDGNSNELYFSEIIGNFTVDDDLDIQSTRISKVNLNGTPTQTIIVSNREYILDLTLNGSDLYWDEEFDSSNKFFKFQTDIANPVPLELYSFIDDFPENLVFYNDKLLYAGYEFFGGSEFQVIKALDLTQNPVNEMIISDPFVFSSLDVETSALLVDNNKLFIAATAYDSNNDDEFSLLYNLDLSTLSVLDFQDVNNLNFFPNPAVNQIKFSDNIKELSIFDTNGRLVDNIKNESDIFQLNHLNSGIYLLKIKTKNDILLHKKIIIE